jgi:hypothetical protein
MSTTALDIIAGGRAAMRRKREPRPIFTLRVEGKPGADNIRALRWLLKSLLRQHGFRCLDVSECEPSTIEEEIP